MTETDKTRTPLTIPEKFLPYLDRLRIYQLFKDVTTELILNLPKDHIKFLKVFMNRNRNTNKLTDRIMVLKSPELKFDVGKLAKELVRDLGYFVVTRRVVMDRYEKHDDYVPGCVSPELLAEVTKQLTFKEAVTLGGWIMFDHPCTVREARCLQMEGVLPTVTLNLCLAPTQDSPSFDPHTPARSFFTQDYQGLLWAYKHTLKDVYIEPDATIETIANKCFTAVRVCSGGAQGAKQGFNVLGAPSVYRVVIIGPRGSGQKTQAQLAAKHFGLVYVNFQEIYRQAFLKEDELGNKLRKLGLSLNLKKEIVFRRLLEKDCVDRGWIITEFPTNAEDFECLEDNKIYPNRVIFLNLSMEMCRKRLETRGVDCVTGEWAVMGSNSKVYRQPYDDMVTIERELDTYFSDILPELRAAAGTTAVEINAEESVEQIQVKIQAAIIAAPELDIEFCTQLRNVRGD